MFENILEKLRKQSQRGRGTPQIGPLTDDELAEGIIQSQPAVAASTLHLQERNVRAQERQADALERIADSLEKGVSLARYSLPEPPE